MIELVVLDLDNTLYDWVGYYVPAFRAMLAEVSRLTGVPKDELKASFQRVHQRHGTSEYAFAIEELDVLQEFDQHLTIPERLEKYATAIDAFRELRAERMCLYPGTAEVLEALHREDRQLVAYTDAMMFYATRRLKQLGIEHFFSGLVAQRDHGLPPGVRPEWVRSSDDESKYQTLIPHIEELEPGLVKPSPEILLEIVRDFETRPEKTVYVGDSLHRDVYMAQLAGVHDIYASYGRSYPREYFAELVEITHWTEEDVARERDLHRISVEPSQVIDSIRELPRALDTIDRLEPVETVRSVSAEAAL
jgi:FMN phosphatase YigB (HAD superfamily)